MVYYVPLTIYENRFLYKIDIKVQSFVRRNKITIPKKVSIYAAFRVSQTSNYKGLERSSWYGFKMV